AGVGPLGGRKRASPARRGRCVRIPVAPPAATVIFLFVTGTQDPAALVSYGLVSFAGYTTLVEFYRGVRARMGKGESAFTALWKLFGRNRRRYGGYFIHLGVVVIGIGVIGSTIFQQQTQETLRPGPSLTLGNTTMVYNNAFQADADDSRSMVIANVSVFKGGQHVADIRPRKDLFCADAQGSTVSCSEFSVEKTNPMSIAGQYSTLESDFYVLLTSWEGDKATFKVYLNPLINLIWWGGIVLMIGTAIAAWPSPEKETVVQVAQAPIPALQLAGD